MHIEKTSPVLLPSPEGPKKGYPWMRNSKTKATHCNVHKKEKQNSTQGAKIPTEIILNVKNTHTRIHV